ncbi:MAG: glutathione S-transferase family protein [Betaproteobacteria bacterium]|nr:MAG: glutathione S-transferase family protein [Betaproteobacteria bacterium]
MYTLYIGNKRFSSWSLRAWALMRGAGIDFEERMISLYLDDTPLRIRPVSPSGRLPCLHDGEVVVWDSLAIAEYLAERHPGLWPGDSSARAWARSVCAEMHSSFASLREEFSMDLKLRDVRAPSAATAADILRIDAIWREGRARFGKDGDFLCGAFGIVDAFWCPVAFRFRSYGVALIGTASAYLNALLALPAMREWDAAAHLEADLHAA